MRAFFYGKPSMPRVEIPDGLSGSENQPRTRRALVNCFNNGQGLTISRPGIAELNTTDSIARGQFVWNENLYQVTGEVLIRIINTETGEFSVIGTIAGSDLIAPAVGFNTAVIVVKGGAIYTLDKTDTIVLISGNANFLPSVAVAHINGRFVYIPSDGDPPFFSDVGDAGSVQATSFFDAEELPDKNNTVFNFKNTLYIGGTDSFELFRDTGASPNPFGRIDGARLDYGFISGLIEYADTFLFIGREKDQTAGIYAIASGAAQKISNEFVDLALADYTLSELDLTIGGRFKWRGYDVATFALLHDSFGFFNGNWFFLTTITNGISGIWGGGFVTAFDGKYYTAFEDRIGRLEKINTDYGERIERIIDTGFAQENNAWFACQSIKLGISQGFNEPTGKVTNDIFAIPDIFELPDIFANSLSFLSDDFTVGIFMSRNNVEYGEGLFRELGPIGDYSEHLEWNYAGGLGSYNGFMGVRIYTVQDLDFSNAGMVAFFR